MSVESARLRLATQEEVSYAKGGYLWRCLTYPWDLLNKIMGLWILYKSGPNTLGWQTPQPLAAAHSVARYLGWSPERSFIRVLPTPLGTWHMIDNEEKVLRAFFENHRNGNLFDCSRSFKMIADTLKDTFPECEFTDEDCIFTCSPQQTKIYRNMISKFLRGPKMKEVIQDEIRKTLEIWAKESGSPDPINATKETRLLASNIITRLLFDQAAGNESLTKSISFVNHYIVKKCTKSATPKDGGEFKEALQNFRSAVTEVMNRGEEIPLFEGKVLTDSQKKAMIFIIFFAGQETVASLLNYILWQLAANPEKQSLLTTDKVHNFFIRSIHDFPPAHGVARILKSDACLEYLLKGESEIRKVIMFKGESLAAWIIKAAANKELPEEPEEKLQYSSWYPFGSGPHRCPGETLAVNEVKEFIEAVMSDYRLTLDHPKEVSKVGSVTLQLSEDIFINIARK